MNSDLVMSLGAESLKTAALLAAPLLICALVVGLVVSIMQAVTQINESTLSFIPKLMAVAVVMVICGPWMLDLMTRFTTTLFENIVTYVR